MHLFIILNVGTEDESEDHDGNVIQVEEERTDEYYCFALNLKRIN